MYMNDTAVYMNDTAVYMNDTAMVAVLEAIARHTMNCGAKTKVMRAHTHDKYM